MSALRSAALAAALAGLGTSPALAVDRLWIGSTGRPPGDGVSFADPLNWSPAGVPTLGDTAVFATVGGAVVLPGAAVVNDRLLIGTEVGIDLAGGLYQLVSPAATGLGRGLIVGGAKGELGSMTIANGSLLALHAGVGVGAGSQGVIHVASDATLQSAELLTLGEAGYAQVALLGQLLSGGVQLAQLPGSSALVVADAPSAVWVALGDVVAGAGDADLQIRNGALSLVLGSIELAAEGDGTASLLLTGLGSDLLGEGALAVGGTSDAAAGIGAVVVADQALGRMQGPLHVWGGSTVQVAGARLDVTAMHVTGGLVGVDEAGTLLVGSSTAPLAPGLFTGVTPVAADEGAPSEIDVDAGAVLTTATAKLGPAPGSVSTIALRDPGTLLEVADDAQLGWLPTEGFARLGKAHLAVRDGAEVEVGGELLVQQRGHVEIAGGALTAGLFQVTEHGTLATELPDVPGAPAAQATQGAALAGGLFAHQETPGLLPPYGAVYRAVEAPFIEGRFSVVSTPLLPALRYFRVETGRNGRQEAVTLTVDKLPVLVGLAETSPVGLPGAPNAIIAGVFDGDALADAFVTIPGADDASPGTAHLLINSPGGLAGTGGGFVIGGTLPVGAAPSGLGKADFDFDGLTDFVVSSETDGTLEIIFNATDKPGDGGLSAGPVVAVGGKPRSVMAADLNGDGRPDLAWVDRANNTVGVAYGDAQGGFTKMSTYSAGQAPATVCPIDLDNDKDVDLVVVNTGGATGLGFGHGSGGSGGIGGLDGSASTVAVYRNLVSDGGEEFGPPELHEVGAGAIDIGEADLDGDGRFEMVTANFTDRTISVLVGRDNAGFAPAIDLPAGGAPFAIALGDFDNDESKDVDIALLVLNDLGEPALSIYRNDSYGGQLVLTLIENAQELIGLPQAITSEDTDGDGPADLVFVGDLSDGTEGYISVLVAVPMSCDADLDGDAMVDGQDLGRLLTAFGTSDDPAADLDGSGVVDGADVAILLSAWGPCFPGES